MGDANALAQSHIMSKSPSYRGQIPMTKPFKTMLNLTLPFPMNFFEKTFRDWKVMLEPMAARKPPQLNVASVADARATPPTIGTRVKRIGTVGVSPKNMAESTTEKNGSIACTTAPRVRNVCMSALGQTQSLEPPSLQPTLGSSCPGTWWHMCKAGLLALEDKGTVRSSHLSANTLHYINQ